MGGLAREAIFPEGSFDISVPRSHAVFSRTLLTTREMARDDELFTPIVPVSSALRSGSKLTSPHARTRTD